MSSKNNGALESMRDKLLLLALDKLVLGVVLAGVAYLFSLQLQNHQILGDYQKGLFEKRLVAYEALLKLAKQARDKCLEVYLARPDNPGSTDVSWRRRLAESRDKAKQLYPSSGFSRGSTGWTTYDEVIVPLQDIEDARRDNILFLSETAIKAIDQFLNTLLTDIDETVRRVGAKDPLNDSEEHAAWERTNSAYEELRRIILQSLRVNEVILG